MQTDTEEKRRRRGIFVETKTKNVFKLRRSEICRS